MPPTRQTTGYDNYYPYEQPQTTGYDNYYPYEQPQSSYNPGPSQPAYDPDFLYGSIGMSQIPENRHDTEMTQHLTRSPPNLRTNPRPTDPLSYPSDQIYRHRARKQQRQWGHCDRILLYLNLLINCNVYLCLRHISIYDCFTNIHMLSHFYFDYCKQRYISKIVQHELKIHLDVEFKIHRYYKHYNWN